MENEQPDLLCLGADDVVTLAPGVCVAPGGLADAATREVHPLNHLGIFIASRLDGDRRFGDLIDEVSVAYDVPRLLVWDDTLGFLSQLNSRSLIRVQSGTWLGARVGREAREVMASRGLVLFGRDWLRPVTKSARRRPPKFRYLPGACFEAHRLLILLVLLLSAVSAAATLTLSAPATDSQWRAWQAMILAPAVLVLVHLVLMVVHEAGHLAAMQTVGLRPAYTVVRGLAVGVVHRRGDPGQERTVSLAGPLAAFAAGWVLTFAAGLSSWPSRHVPQVMALFPAAVGVAHLFSLTPWGADGKQLLWARRGKRDAPETGDNDGSADEEADDEAEDEAADGVKDTDPVEASSVALPSADHALRLSSCPAVAARGVVVHLGGFTLGPLDLEVGASEILCLVGPNGAGKTTLLRALTGLRPPDSGSTEIAGWPALGRSPEALRRLGWVPDDVDDILPEVTAEELWDLHALAHSSVDGTVDAMRARAAALAERLDFRPPASRIAVYSHGMRKKTQLVAGLLHDPDVVFLDEPRNGLDPIAIERLENLLQELRDGGRAIVLATHDLRYAERVADRVCILHDGQVAALGTLREVLRGDEKELVQAFFRILDE